jgi:hypothetical protein
VPLQEVSFRFGALLAPSRATSSENSIRQFGPEINEVCLTHDWRADTIGPEIAAAPIVSSVVLRVAGLPFPPRQDFSPRPYHGAS